VATNLGIRTKKFETAPSSPAVVWWIAPSAAASPLFNGGPR
jgi:hypothetical protein